MLFSLTGSRLRSAHPSPRRSLRALMGRVEAFVEHHGFWAPGIRLLRNASLRMKAVLLAVVVCAPLVGFAGLDVLEALDDLQRSHQRSASLAAMKGIAVLSRSVSDVARRALGAELGSAEPGLARAIADDQQRFDAYMQGIDRTAWPETTRQAFDMLAERRGAVRQLAANASTEALPGRGGPRINALDDYATQLALLRAEVARSDGISAEAPLPVQTVEDLLVRSLPKLRRALQSTLGAGARLYESPDRARAARRLETALAQATVTMNDIEADLNHGAHHGLLDPSLVLALVSAVQQHLERADALTAAARALDLSRGIADAIGVDRPAYLDGGVAAIRALDAVEDTGFASIDAYAVAEERSQRRHVAWFVGLLGVWVVSGSYLLACTYRVMAGGLKSLCIHLERVGRGDLSLRPQGRGRDEIGRSLNALGASIGHMSQLFGAVTQGVAAVSQASREVAGGNAGLTRRTEDVRTLIASAADRAAACSRSLDSCGEHVEQTAELVKGMRVDGQRTRKAMGGLRASMARLQVKSREIGQVVGLVEAVAYQTKLLSINASIEAARAGPSGRGFAVVAQEVRALANRSEQAAHRIGGILGASIDEIEAGGVTAQRADDAVAGNEERIEAADLLMREAVGLTRVGRTESQQVLSIARHLEESMSGNVRVVEQLAEASAKLRSQGDDLKRSVQHFVFG